MSARRRIPAVLQQEGTGYGRRRVARLMRAAGIRGRYRRRRQQITIAAPAATVHPDPTSRVHAFAREQKILMLTLVTGLVAELGIDSRQLLIEQLVTLADGAVSRAMVLDDPGYGRHARAVAETLFGHALRRPCDT